MEKLNSVGLSQFFSNRSNKKKVQDDKLKRVHFKGNLEQAQRSAQSKALSFEHRELKDEAFVEALLDDVSKMGEKMKEKPTLENLKIYKSAVRKFYQYIVSNSLETKRIKGRLNLSTMSRKEYTVVKLIDDKLEKLGAAVLKNQRDQFSILQKVEEINGLLVDLIR